MPGSTSETPGRIFISYRRQETAYPAAWLYERVAAHFGREQVFKDVDSIKLGDDFAEVIANAVGSCDALLVLIGDRWLSITDEDGRRRLQDPDDFVRLEIETALERNIRVIPVLFEGARLPRAGELPASLAKLVRRQALELSPSRFDTDIGKLLRVLETTLAEEQARREEAAKAAREAEEQARRDAEAQAAREAQEQARRDAEAQAAREAQEQARREEEDRKLSAIDVVAQELRSGSPSAVASAEGALRRLAQDANQRVAQRAASVLADWQAEAEARREAQAKAQLEAEAQAAREAQEQAGREAETPKVSAIEEMANDLRSGDPAAVVSAAGALRRLAQDANQRVAQAASSVLGDWEAEEQARREAEAKAQREAEAAREAEEQARREAEEQARLEVEAEAGREAEEQARREAEEQQARDEAAERKPHEAELFGPHLHSGDPVAKAPAEGAIGRPTSDERPRVARMASPASEGLQGSTLGSHRGRRVDQASFRVAALAVAVVLVISGGYLAFANRQDRGSGRSGGAVGGARNMATVKIGFIAPLTGVLAELGLGMRNSVELAIRQANAKQTVKGYRLVLAAEDDAADPATGANAAKKLAADPQVAGVIGTLNSSVAQSVAPLLAGANIAQISPANANDTLTRGKNHQDAPQRAWPTYFRIGSRDAFQGPFGADYAYAQAGFRTVVVIHDNKTYGQDLAKDFASRFQSKGGKVVGTLTVRQGDTDFQTEANKVVDLHPDMVFYGGEYPEAGPLTRQLKARGFKGVVMGGDGLYAGDFFKGAGGKGEGTLATSPGEPVERLGTARQFVTDYKAAGFKESYSAYGALSYDVANILIQALAKTLPNTDRIDAARPQIVKAVGQTNGFQGVTGEHSFDEFGDTNSQVFTVYRAKGSEWTPVFSGKFAP